MSKPEDRQTSAARFATTHWSVVLAAGQEAGPESRQAVESLCRTYWPPVYAYLRRQGLSCHEAEDLTQDFFARFLARNSLDNASPAKGRFRSYLLGAVKHFHSNARDRAHARKRGGGRASISLDVSGAENRSSVQLSDELTPERIFDKCWALALLDRVLCRLEDEFSEANKTRTFASLKTYLTADSAPPSYKHSADELDMSEGAVRVAVHRLRRRYREILKEEVSGTVTDSEDAEDEIRHLLAAVSA